MYPFKVKHDGTGEIYIVLNYDREGYYLLANTNTQELSYEFERDFSYLYTFAGWV